MSDVNVRRHFGVAAVCFIALAAASNATADPVRTAGTVRLRPVIEHVDLVTDINTVGSAMYVCTQPGLLLRKNLATAATNDYTVFLDLRPQVGTLGSRIPSLAGLGYPDAGTYDERGLLGFAADPRFATNGRFWVWYTAIGESSPNPPGFFQWLVSTSTPWDQSEYDHVGYLAEYRVINGTPRFQRTVLKIKRPYFNHTGFQSLVWSPEHDTLVLGLGDGGSEYDPNNIAQDDDQLSGKLLKIDLDSLRRWDFTNSAPVATFSDLAAQHVPHSAFTTLVKGMRNPSKVSFERTEGDDYIKYLSNTGQDTIEFAHAFDHYGINFGFRPWEGIFPTAFEVEGTRVIAYGLEASNMANIYRPFVEYTHLDPVLGPNANTGSALYRGRGIPDARGDLIFTDWISFAQDPPQGRLMHASLNRGNMQRAQPITRFNIDFSAVGLAPGQPISFTSINTDASGERLFIGAFKDLQFIVNQQNFPLGSAGLQGGVYEVLGN